MAKVLRLPGCVNWKDPSSPKAVQLVHESPDRFDPKDLDELLPPLDIHGSSRRFSGIDAEDRAPITITVDRALKISDDLSGRSDHASGGIGVAIGLPDQLIANLIIASRQRFHGPKQDRKGSAYTKYLQRTISKARESGGLSSDEAEQQWGEIGQQTEPTNGDSRASIPGAGKGVALMLDKSSKI